MPKRSTATNLAILIEFVANALDQRGHVDVIYTDFRKAFDSINIEIVLHKLSLMGLNCSAVSLLDSYLRCRSHYIFYNGVKSKHYEPTSGVPQGSILGPLLFSIFINDLPDCIKTNLLMFADDVKLFKKISNINDCLELQRDIDRLTDWCETNRLQLNPDKCKIMSYTRQTA